MKHLWLSIAWLAVASAAQAAGTQTIAGREAILVLPETLPPEGDRSLLIALHGGGGNAGHMQRHLGMDDFAQQHGVIVAYLNGSHASKRLPDGMRAWNAGGGCCGEPADTNAPDAAYIQSAVAELAARYHIPSQRRYVTGHSNGAMMAQLMLCTTPVFTAGVTMSGPINPTVTSCPEARGKRILAIHGVDDENVPVAGGKGSKGPLRVKENVVFRSEASAKALFEASGASYEIALIPGADHALSHIDDALSEQQHMPLAQRILRFFGV